MKQMVLYTPENMNGTQHEKTNEISNKDRAKFCYSKGEMNNSANNYKKNTVHIVNKIKILNAPVDKEISNVKRKVKSMGETR